MRVAQGGMPISKAKFKAFSRFLNKIQGFIRQNFQQPLSDDYDLWGENDSDFKITYWKCENEKTKYCDMN